MCCRVSLLQWHLQQSAGEHNHLTCALRHQKFQIVQTATAESCLRSHHQIKSWTGGSKAAEALYDRALLADSTVVTTSTGLVPYMGKAGPSDHRHARKQVAMGCCRVSALW